MVDLYLLNPSSKFFSGFLEGSPVRWADLQPVVDAEAALGFTLNPIKPVL